MIREGDSRRFRAAPATPRPAAAQPVAALRAFLPASLVLALVVLAAAAATPALAAAKPAKQRFTTETPLTSFQPPVSDAGRFSFTASGGNPAAARLQSSERAFRFTPSGQNDNKKALSIGVSTRVVSASTDRSRAAPPADTLSALPTAYNVGLSVGWKGFAVNTGYGRVEPGPTALLGGRRDSVDLGLSYGGKNWKTSVQGTAEAGSLLAQAPLERRYSVEVGGAYALAPRVSVSGGVRYKLAPIAPSLLDPNRADPSVYLGTNVAF